MGIETSTIKFFKDLEKNNNREWFQSHKAQYESTLENIKELSAEGKEKLSKKNHIEDAKKIRI